MIKRVYRQAAKFFNFPTWTIPIALLIICVLSYGSMISKLGLYWDDWTAAYYIRFLGVQSFKEAFAVDRPLLAAIYIPTASLLGEAPLNWHLFSIFTRWLSCLALWWALSGVWPQKQVQAASTAILFAVYPGFSQSHIAITYSNVFLVYTLFILSLGLMAWGFRKPRWFWLLYISSIALSGYVMFTVEYFFGLEFLRPVIIWMIIAESAPNKRKTTLHSAIYWTPYLVFMLLFLVWRIATPSPRAEITILNDLIAAPARAIFDLGSKILQDIFKVGALAWRQTLEFSKIMEYGPAAILNYTLIILGAFLLITLYLASLRPVGKSGQASSPSSRDAWGFQAVLIGLFSLLIGGAPVWMTNLRIELFFPWDRFTLPMMLGVSLFLVGLIDLLTKTRVQSAILVGIAVGIAAGSHYENTLTYRKEWLLQKDFFWQLVWRAPGIEPGTVLLTTEMPFEYNWDNSLTAPLNWIYAPDNRSREFPYLLYNVESRLSRGLPEFEETTAINEIHRITPFNGSTSQAVMVFYRPPGCLKVMDPVSDRRFPDKPRFFIEALEFSNLDFILTESEPPAIPPVDILGPEPEHDWCYTFEKADLARQRGNWQEVARLGDEALDPEKRFYRRNVAELVPFIEGYAHTGQWDKAVALTKEAYDSWENMGNILCDSWGTIFETSEPNELASAAYKEIQQTIQCQKP